ncbi:MAG: L-serine ammonia-lyase, iron-sulfur-dependent, subunit alpha [Thermanaeromonas sp.]|uniref:L-serine ammonia-lyase, iron-sulfur-dependent, subunit alpha n=1 Tax=Thermanaeromonas sp. TaxID=2003697 RepID=UPI00243A2F96|nr:L-serine ammonia-lyase, iron-sulfur-dependent, subunit alpha [Thermanaeromonas sp.]MCG0278428.1 L-serine ammonia-lyase, iron-sulfur-dependent, subunit alpha [Thermanaeromonas sp.]
MPSFKSTHELLYMIREKGLALSEAAQEWEKEVSGRELTEIRQEMRERLLVMRQAARKGLEGNIKSPSGLIGGGGRLLEQARKENKLVSGATTARAITIALAIAEVNACMGKIVAAPTAGSCGILPGVLLALEEERKLSEETVIDGMLAAAAVGVVMASMASFSGAALGCQAEVGAASAMAAAATVEMAGGSPLQALDAAAIALKGLMGLVCDPVGGLVEIPCVKRNALGAAHALAAADIALAGLKSFIPLEEVIAAMVEVGKSLPSSLRETAEGGIAACPTAKKIASRLT